MVFTLHKFNHYLLGNKFVFYVNDIALVYLVNKPQVSIHIATWLLLFLEYEFIIVYKLGCTHVVVDALSTLSNTTELTKVLDQTTNVTLFMLQLVWLKEVKNYL
jgi:hypothetical protein